MEKIRSSKKSRSILLRIALCVFVVYVIGMLVTLQSQIDAKEREYSELQNQIAEQKLENAEIEKSLETDDEDYIERYAREEFGYAKPGDKIFVDIAGN